jgi:ribosome-associated protein
MPLAEIELRASRSSGPGGQHANVTASRLEAVFDVPASSLGSEGEARVLARLGPRPRALAQDTRSQARNRELALERLGERLAEALEVPKARCPTRPSRRQREGRLAAKRRTSARKEARRRPANTEGAPPRRRSARSACDRQDSPHVAISAFFPPPAVRTEAPAQTAAAGRNGLYPGTSLLSAEGEGFEPPVPVIPGQRFSRPSQSVGLKDAESLTLSRGDELQLTQPDAARPPLGGRDGLPTRSRRRRRRPRSRERLLPGRKW